MNTCKRHGLAGTVMGSTSEQHHRAEGWRLAEVVIGPLDQGLMRVLLYRKLVKLGFV